MQVLDHAQGFWYLLEENSLFYLDINCPRGHWDFSVLTQLTREESSEYQALGTSFLNELAITVCNAGSARQLEGEIQERATAAIYAWLGLKNSS